MWGGKGDKNRLTFGQSELYRSPSGPTPTLSTSRPVGEQTRWTISFRFLNVRLKSWRGVQTYVHVSVNGSSDSVRIRYLGRGDLIDRGDQGKGWTKRGRFWDPQTHLPNLRTNPFLCVLCSILNIIITSYCCLKTPGWDTDRVTHGYWSEVIVVGIFSPRK